VFSGGILEIITTGNDHVLGFQRTHGKERAIVIANFSETPQTIAAEVLKENLSDEVTQIYGTSKLLPDQDLKIQPLEFLVIRMQSG
ncbi:MAG: alpha-glucosidase C-terminal domain-containing protein, partial [Anaerolineales bacterium]